MKNLIILSTFFWSCTLCSQNTLQDSIFHDGIYRHFTVHIPPAYEETVATELLFVLHGGTGSATGMMLYTGFNLVSDTANFIVVYPQGIYTGPNLSGNRGHHWADGRMTTIPDVNGIDDVDFISQLIDELSMEYNINAQKIYAAGISNGGYMAQRLACQLSDKITAVASVAATFPDSLLQFCHDPAPISILIMNGTNDIFVPTYTGGMATGTGGYVLSTDEMVDQWIARNNCSELVDSIGLPDLASNDQSTVSTFNYKDCLDECEILHYKIYGGGHTWPGEIFHIPFTGLVNEDINANEEIWNFFKTKSKDNISALPTFETDVQAQCFPNPFSNQLNIRWSPNFKVQKIALLDTAGKTIWQTSNLSMESPELTKQLDFLKNGLYHLQLVSDQQHRLVKILKTGN